MRAEDRTARRASTVRPAGVASDAVMRVLRVPPESGGMRLDRFVQAQLRSTSRTRAQRIVERSAFSPEGASLRNNHRVRADERVVLWRPPWDEETPDVALTVVYEDDDLLAISKPPFIVAHPTARYHNSSVVVMLREQRPDEHITLLHRLDRETSGVLLTARTRQADRAVKLQLEARRDVVKEYVTFVWGWPAWEHHRCELPLELDPAGSYRVKMRVAAPGTGLPSATTFVTEERRGRAGKRYARIRCMLHTGRQHQIRVHLAALGLPVVGDKLYGPDDQLFGRAADGALTDEDRLRLELDRHALHACAMEIQHPTGLHRLRIEAPLPHDLRTFWDTLVPEGSGVSTF